MFPASELLVSAWFSTSHGRENELTKTKMFGDDLDLQLKACELSTEQVKASRINSARMVFNRLHTALWSRRDISHKTKSQFYTAVVRTILLYGWETWPLQVEDRKRLEVFYNDCLRHIEKCNRRDRVPCSILRQRLQLPTLPALLLQRRLRWFDHAAHRAPGGFTRELINPDVPQTWRKRTDGQLKTWAATLKEDLVRLIGPVAIGI